MDPRWQRIEEIFGAAAELPQAERGAYLERACAGDEGLRREVESLLSHDEPSEPFVEAAVAAAAAAAPRPTLPVGHLVGPYRVTGVLGEGGMGVVYKAEDTRLARTVALKFVKIGFSERFLREAKAISALNHPNIITIHDIASEADGDFIVMEYVAGKTLNQSIGRKGLKLNETLKCAIQIADALAAAHAAGIVHRDLKPGNVMVTESGLVKVLDFGLAKLIEAAPADAFAPTQPPRPHTAEGTIVGTVAYMSPEQAEGKPVDARSDIFSFGSVLYEVVTGQRAFKGDSTISTLAAILREEPKPVSQVGVEVPRDLEKVITRCLRKDRERRYQHMADVKLALEELKEESDSGKVVAPAAGRRKRLPHWLLIPAVAILLAAAVGVTWWLSRGPKATPAPTVTRLTSDSGLTTDPALSQDGKLLAYASDRSGEGNLDIYVRQVGGGEPIRLTRDPADEREPAFSPDGTSIAFRSEREGGAIYLVSALGGPARRIALEGRRPQFSPDGNWIAYWVGVPGLVAGSGKIYVVASAGGVPKRVQPDFSAAGWPVWSPDGRRLLFLGNRDVKLPPEEAVDWWVTPLDSGPALRTGALEATRNQKLAGPLWVYPWALVAPTWDPEGDSLVFSARSGDSVNLWRIGISPKTWKVTGLPQRVTSGPTLEENPSVASGLGGLIRVAFASLTDNIDIWSLPVETNQGKVTGEPQRLTQDAAPDFHPALSADGSRMVFVSGRPGDQEVWIKNLRTGQDLVLTASRSNKYRPLFSPDGSKVSFSSDYEGGKWNIYVVPTAGGAPEMICEDCGQLTGWSSDGKRTLGNSINGRAWLLEPASGRKTELLARPGSHVAMARFSPDDRWISFLEIGRGSYSTYIVPSQGEGPIGESSWIPITSDGWGPWSPDGRLIYFPSRRDGFTCFWAQRLDPVTKHPAGDPFAIFHSHSSRRSLANQNEVGVSVGRDKIVFSMGERTGNIWMAEWKAR